MSAFNIWESLKSTLRWRREPICYLHAGHSFLLATNKVEVINLLEAVVVLDAGSTELVQALLDVEWVNKNIGAHTAQQRLFEFVK
jgi:hypothetical protein